MKNILLIAIISLIITSACRMKEQCELNNNGEICLTNNLSVEVEVYINQVKVMTLSAGEQKCINKNVGEYTLKCFSLLDEWTIGPVLVEQCKKTILRLPEDAWED